MNICKADAIAQLAKWYSSETQIRAIHRSVIGNTLIVGRMSELTASTIKIAGDGCEMLLYFRDTSEYEYSDPHEPLTENHGRTNKYPALIDIKFSNGDRVQVSEFFPDS